MRTRNAQLGNSLGQPPRDGIEIRDPETDIKAATVAAPFTAERLIELWTGFLDNSGQDRPPTFGRRQDQGQFAYRSHRQLKRARDRCRGEREHMHA
jgi:hypothetical protein